MDAVDGSVDHVDVIGLLAVALPLPDERPRYDDDELSEQEHGSGHDQAYRVDARARRQVLLDKHLRDRRVGVVVGK